MEQLSFFLSIILILFLPGYFFMRAIWIEDGLLHPLEKILISLGGSLVIVDFIMLVLGKFNVPLRINYLSITIFIIILFFIGIRLIRKKINHQKNKPSKETFSFSRSQTTATIAILFLTVLIKTIYLENTIFPTSTDLGHHMYWAKTITETGQLPVYEESDVISTSDGYTISQPQAIADFIIGEHLIFSAIASFSKISLISAFPSLILFLINIFSIVAIFVLALEIFKKYPHGTNMAIATLFFIGPIYALSSPQAKFVSGGVIGNMLGNFLIPLIFLFLLKALREKKSTLLAIALFFALGLVFTHHLSTLIFIFSFIFIFLFFCIFNFKKLFYFIKEWLILLFSPPVLLIISIGIIMIFFFHTPSYLNFSAVDTAVGTPSKSTRTGLSINQLMATAGEIRMIFGFLGLIILLFFKKNKDYGSSFVSGWLIAVFLMSFKPNLLFIDIPSNRVASYIIFPLAILSGLTFVKIFNWTKNYQLPIKSSYLIVIFFISMVFAAQGGFTDNSNSLSDGGNIQAAIQTFHASEYLATFTQTDRDVVLKDHNYLTADAWMKLYFMDGYNYPFSRGFFKRYEDVVKKREQCTLLMISAPYSTEAERCFNGTKVNFIMVNPRFDSAQFQKTRNFWQTYTSNEITIFYKPN